MTKLSIRQLLTTGTPDGTKFLRDDGAWVVPAGGSGGAMPAAFATRTAGNIEITSTSYVDVDTDLDVSVVAAAGDLIEVGLGGAWMDQTVDGHLNVATLVSGAPMHYVSPGGRGAPQWFGRTGRVENFGGSVFYTVVSGDIADGEVTLRLRAKASTTDGKYLGGDSDFPLHVMVKNVSRVG